MSDDIDETTEDENPQNGFREGIPYPIAPVTAEERKQLLENPDKPAENQSAPAEELLNPHLFTNR